VTRVLDQCLPCKCRDAAKYCNHTVGALRTALVSASYPDLIPEYTAVDRTLYLEAVGAG